MAVVVRDSRNRSPFWYACYTTADGRRLKKSTKETNQAKAKLIAEAVQSAENTAAERTLTAVRTRKLLSDVLQRVSGERLHVFTVRDWFEQFTNKKRKSRSQKTAIRYEQMMNEFVAFLGPRADLNIAAITERDILEFRELREAKGLAPVTVNLDTTVLSAVFNAALRQGHISVNPCACIEPLKDKTTHKKTFTPEQVSALLSAANGDWRGVILIGFYSGMRLNDACNLRWRDIDLVSPIKTITYEPRKTGEAVTVAVHPTLEDYLLSLPAPDNEDVFLFPSLAQRKNVSPLSKAFRKIMHQARIAQSVIRERNQEGRSVYSHSFHSLRHSFSTILANNNVSEEVRMRLTGHTTRGVHQKYTHHDLERLRNAISVIPSLSL
jgi:integrase